MTWCLPFLLFLFHLNAVCWVNAHQSVSFPGTEGNKIPTHLPPSGEQQQYHQQQFGGEHAKDEGHIKEHLEGKVDPTVNMTPKQLQFHYFNLHDLNKDHKLDGLELHKAIAHFHEGNPGPQHTDTKGPPPLPSEIEFEHMIDSILQEDDYNGDHFIDYGEFQKAQEQREQHTRQHPPPPPT